MFGARLFRLLVLSANSVKCLSHHGCKPPATTALGALLNHLSTPAKHFQPSNVHFGLMPEPEVRVKKKERKQWYADRARAAFGEWLKGLEKEGD